MTTLAEIKTRLSALPLIRESRNREETYTALLAKTTQSMQKVELAVRSAGMAAEVFSAADYADTLKYARMAGKIASGLRATLEHAPHSITDTATDKKFGRLGENAATAWSNCQTVWRNSIESKVKDWEPLIQVLSRLMPAQGQNLRSTIDTLNAARNSPPASKTDVQRIVNALHALNEVVAKLGLQTGFGGFLRAVGSAQGASLSDAFDAEVLQTIKDNRLERVFRVKLV